MPHCVMWKFLTAADLRAKAAAGAIVVLPVASMEQHGPHLPVGVDTILTEAVCQAAAEVVAGDAAVVVAPTLWCGMAEHHMAFGGTFTFDIPTYRSVLHALLASIGRHGFKRVLIVNGHGGNIAALAAFLPDSAGRGAGGSGRRASRLRSGDLHDAGRGSRQCAARTAPRSPWAGPLVRAAGWGCALPLVPRHYAIGGHRRCSTRKPAKG